MNRAILLPSLLAAAIAGAFAIATAESTAAASAFSGAAVIKAAAPTGVVEARWRRWRWGWYGSYRRGCHIAGGYYRPNGCW
jgi:hypothetical protein